jgi:hypothetical protein
MRANFRPWTLGATIFVALGLSVAGLAAHKGNTSKYTFDDDVFPILREHCGQCHVDGGSAPMSLMNYSGDGGAVAWAESMKQMVLAEAMPPWFVDPTGPAIKGGHSLSAHEVDVLVTWASGGTPQGDLNRKPKPMTAHARWRLGEPDLTLPIPQSVSLGPGEMEREADFSIPVPLTEARWIVAADLLPGTASIVRSASIQVDDGPILAVWEPGDEPLLAPDGAAFALKRGDSLKVHIRYRKSFLDEQQARIDRSAVGLYFARSTNGLRAIRGVMASESKDVAPGAFALSPSLGGDARIVALRPRVDQAYGSLSINAVTPAGDHIALLKLRGVRPEWPRRYWLEHPIELPANSTLEVAGTPADAEIGPLGPSIKSALQIGLDIVTP